MPVVQLLLAAAACLGLWRLCRAQPKIVIVGFLVRAFVGQALFWISYLRLPVARSLQLGNGFWFFAVDGPFYLGYATKLVARGPAAILLNPEQYPSQFFVQVLSLCVGAFGSVASVAILLNCAAYLLTCAIIVRVFRTRNYIVLAAIACSPASILFSLQPLKDTLFMLLIVAMIAAFRRWEELWRAGGTGAQFLGYAVAICAVIYALSGIRWYFSVIACAAAAIFFVLTALQAQRKGWAFVTIALLLLLLAQSIRLGAHDLPPSYERLLDPMTALQWRPTATQEHIAIVRHGFDSTPGATTIAEGEALAKPDIASTPATTTIAEGGPVAKSDIARASPASAPPRSAPRATTIADDEADAKPDIARALPASVPSRTTPATTTIAEVEGDAKPDIARASPASVPLPTPPPSTTIAEVEADAKPDIAPDIAPPRPASSEPAASQPPGLTSRIITGFAAMFLPRILGESLGLIHVGGGRGLWLFAEVDTLLFDLVLLYAIVHCVRRLRRGRAKITATFVFCVLLLVMTAGPMLYTVNNFGTLFRLRLMVYCVAAVLPITLREITLREEGDAIQ